MIRAVAAHQTGIVVGFWLFCLLGLAIAVPAAIHDGFFGEPGPAPLGASQGTLVVEPGRYVFEPEK